MGVRGNRGWSKGGLIDHYRALLTPQEVSYGTRFGSKHHIMVQLAYVYRVGITDPLSDLWSSPKGYNISRKRIGTLESSKIPYI